MDNGPYHYTGTGKKVKKNFPPRQIEFFSLSYDTIGNFIQEAAEQEGIDPRFLLGKAAAYVDCAYAAGQITELEARELLTCVSVYMVV